jgi:F-type H+-transporting ATPase subunit b
MGTFVVLMAEAAAVGGELAEGAKLSGFGLNTNILETNLINLAIIITLLFVFGRKVLGNNLKTRREKIETAIKNAEQKAATAANQLEEAQQKLTQAQAEATRIKAEAEESAKAAEAKILEQATADVEKMKASGAADLNADLDKAIAQLRQKVVAQALQKAETELQAGISPDAQVTIIDRSIAQLGG